MSVQEATVSMTERRIVGQNFFVAGPGSTAGSRIKLGFADFIAGISHYEIWSALAWQDIRKRYQRSLLGPFWITLTMLVMIGGMGPIYAILFKADVREFLPYLALGIITWGLISPMILEGCAVFQQSQQMIQSVKLPMTVYVAKLIYTNVIIFFHNILAFIPVMIFFSIKPEWVWLMAIPGLILIIIASIPLVFILGPLCTRFRDLSPIIASLMQVLFFLTPIFWQAKMLGPRQYFVDYNPFFLFVNLIRTPFSGQIPDVRTYLGVGLVIIVLYAVAIPVFARCRSRISAWV